MRLLQLWQCQIILLTQLLLQIKSQCPAGTYIYSYRIQYRGNWDSKARVSGSTVGITSDTRSGIVKMQLRCGRDTDYYVANTNVRNQVVDVASTSASTLTLPWTQWQAVNVAVGQYLTNFYTMKVAPGDASNSFTTTTDFNSLIGSIQMASLQVYGQEFRYTKYAEEHGLYAEKMHKLSTFPYWKLANTTATNTFYKDTFPNTHPIQRPITSATDLGTFSNQVDLSLVFSGGITNLCDEYDPIEQKWADPAGSPNCFRCDPNNRCLTCDKQTSACLSCRSNTTIVSTSCVFTAAFRDIHNRLFQFTGYSTGSPTAFPQTEIDEFVLTNNYNAAGTSPVTLTNQMPLLGGIGVLGVGTTVKHSRTNIQAHSKIFVIFKLVIYGYWHNNKLFIEDENAVVYQPLMTQSIYNSANRLTEHHLQNVQTYSSNYLGNLAAKEIYVKQMIPHNFPSISITLKTDLATPTNPVPDTPWWGIREFSLVEEKCHLSCKSCNGIGEYKCLDCHGRMALRNNYCQCKPKTYRVIIPNCMLQICVECRPCPISCDECTGPSLSQCLGCQIHQYKYLKADGTEQCYDKCPPGTYGTTGLKCISCGKVCDNIHPVILSLQGYTQQSHPAVFAYISSDILIEKGYNAYLKTYQLSFTANQWYLTQKDVQTDDNQNSFPISRAFYYHQGNLYSGYPNGIVSYIQTTTLSSSPDKFLLKQNFLLAKSCSIMIESVGATGYYLCGDYGNKQLIELKGQVTTWTCQLQVPIYSLYIDQSKLDTTSNSQYVWVGALNQVLLVSKPGCQVLKTFTFSTLYSNALVTHILPSALYGRHLLVLAAYDSSVQQIELQTYQAGSQISSISKLNGISISAEYLSPAESYKFQVLLVPLNTVVVISTKTQLFQYDYLTYQEYSQLLLSEQQINYMSLVSPNKTTIFRQSQSLSNSTVYHHLWQPYPCLQATLNSTGAFQCTLCDPTNSQVRLFNGKCETSVCTTGYLLDSLNEICLKYSQIGTLQTNIQLQVDLNANQGLPTFSTKDQLYRVLVTGLDSSLQIVKVTLSNNQYSATLEQSYIDPQQSTATLINDSNHTDSLQTIRLGSLVIHSAPRLQKLYFVPLVSSTGLLDLSNLYIKQQTCNSIHQMTTNQLLCAHQNTVQLINQDGSLGWSCNMNSTIYQIHSQPTSYDHQQRHYFWVTLFNQLEVHSILNGHCIQEKVFPLSTTTTLANPSNITNCTDYIPHSISTLDIYTDDALLLVVSYSPSTHSLLLNSYLSNSGKHHNKDYSLLAALSIPLPSSLAPPSQLQPLKVSPLTFAQNIYIYIANQFYLVDAVHATLLYSFNTNQHANLVFSKLSLDQNMDLFLQSINQKVFFNLARSHTVCAQQDTLQPLPKHCTLCNSQYTFNTNKECVIRKCLPKFNKNDFGSNQADCLSPPESTIASLHILTQPTHFQVVLDNKDYSELLTIDPTLPQHSTLSIAHFTSPFTYTAFIPPNALDTLDIQVNLPQYQILLPKNTFTFTLKVTNKIKYPFFLEAASFVIPITNTMINCPPDRYYDQLLSKCLLKTNLTPLITFPNNPVVIQIDFQQNAKKVLTHFQQNPHLLNINIQGLIFGKHFKINIEIAENSEQLVMVSIEYLASVKLSEGQELTLMITTPIVTGYTFTFLPLYTFSLHRYEQPADTNNFYFDPLTGQIAKKKLLQPKKLQVFRGNQIKVQMSTQDTNTFKSFYKNLFKVQIFRQTFTTNNNNNVASNMNSQNNLGHSTSQSSSSNRRLQQVNGQYQNYNNFQYTVINTNGIIELKLIFNESFSDRPQAQVQLQSQKYMNINSDSKISSNALTTSLQPNIVTSSSEQQQLDQLQSAWQLLQPLFYLMIILHALVYPRCLHAFQILLLAKQLVYYRFIYLVDMSSPMQMIFSSLMKDIPAGSQQQYPIDTVVPAQLQQYNVSHLLIDNIQSVVLKLLASLVLAFIIKLIFTPSAKLINILKENDLSDEQQQKQHRSLQRAGKIITMFVSNLPLALWLVLYLDLSVYSQLDIVIQGEQQSISYLLYLFLWFLALFFLAIVYLLNNIYQQHLKGCTALQELANQMVFMHYNNPYDLQQLPDQNTYQNVSEHQKSIVIHDLDQLDQTGNNNSKQPINSRQSQDYDFYKHSQDQEQAGLTSNDNHNNNSNNNKNNNNNNNNTTLSQVKQTQSLKQSKEQLNEQDLIAQNNKKQQKEEEKLDTLSEEDNEFRITKLTPKYILDKLLTLLTCCLPTHNYRLVYYSYNLLVDDMYPIYSYSVLLELLHSLLFAYSITNYLYQPLQVYKALLLLLVFRIMLLGYVRYYKSTWVNRWMLFNYLYMLLITLQLLYSSFYSPYIQYDQNQQFQQALMNAQLFVGFIVVNTIYLVVRIVIALCSRKSKVDPASIIPVAPVQEVQMVDGQILIINNDNTSNNQSNNGQINNNQKNPNAQKIKDLKKQIQILEKSDKDEDIYKVEELQQEIVKLQTTNFNIIEDNMFSPGSIGSANLLQNDNQSIKTQSQKSLSSRSRDIRAFSVKQEQTKNKQELKVISDESINASLNNSVNSQKKQEAEPQDIIQDNDNNE